MEVIKDACKSRIYRGNTLDVQCASRVVRGTSVCKLMRNKWAHPIRYCRSIAPRKGSSYFCPPMRMYSYLQLWWIKNAPMTQRFCFISKLLIRRISSILYLRPMIHCRENEPELKPIQFRYETNMVCSCK